ncbi:HAMP domain-containing sensor histidine kinase [Halobacteriovorax sp. GB3]|uniref:sensor histidine kinase n=1 Tax=Halobacteriovorax sp. GB3 TaxID=2719615 RepID=UPI00235E3844|nr:HAMP domain-containing sensor histidine kinase [Halobacteriovorax sp. GB3]MDD0853190.1 HAMP domain-containing sensor histidine kinase [Halobacteriovorax sp. GB3]
MTSIYHKTIKLYGKLFYALTKEGLEKNDLERRRLHSFILSVLSTSLLMWSYTLIALLYFESSIPFYVGLVCSIIHLLSVFTLRWSASRLFAITNIMLAAGVIHQSTFAYFSGGFNSNILIWFGVIPFLAGLICGIKGALLWSLIVGFLTSIFLGLQLSGHIFPYDISVKGHLLAQGFICFGYIFLSGLLISIYLGLEHGYLKILSEKNNKIQNLLRVILHDILNPLTIVYGASYRLKKMVERDLLSLEKVENEVQKIDRASKTITSILEQVRNMHTYESKEFIKRTPCSMKETIEHIEFLFREKLDQKQIELSVFGLENDISVLAEKTILENQILGNVISNAIKFSDQNSKLHITLKEHFDFICIEVKDFGIGIPKKMLDKMKDNHINATRKGTSGEKGNGLGVLILKSFTELFDGELTIDSKTKDESPKDHGTSVKIYLRPATLKAEHQQQE